MRKNRLLWALCIVIISVMTVFTLAACNKEAVALPKGDYSPVLAMPMPSLSLNDEGKFEILQLTDLHLLGNDSKTDDKTYDGVDKLLKAKNYDLVIITGDMLEGVTSKSYNKPKAIAQLISIFDANDQAFTYVAGNNDGEYLGSNEDIILSLLTSSNFVIADTNNVGGVGNYYIKLLDKAKIERHRLVFIDTRMRDDKGKYLHIEQNQIDWYNSVSAECAANGIKLSLFTHIPFNNTKTMIENGENVQGMTNFNGIKNFYSEMGNNNQPLYDAVKLSGSCGLIVSGHMHDIEITKYYDGIYFKITRASGYFSKINKELKYGGAEINIDTTKPLNIGMYSFAEVNY